MLGLEVQVERWASLPVQLALPAMQLARPYPMESKGLGLQVFQVDLQNV
jgi:hypothetical protein